MNLQGHLPPALLTMADFYGTLAAARCFGRAGIAVTMADSRWLAPARWSRYVTRRESSPSVEGHNRFFAWLLEFGRRNPGHVLYPTSDELALLFSVRRQELGAYFRLLQPSSDALRGLLNKKALYAAAKDVGLETPRTWFPESDTDLSDLMSEADFPLLIKPRTQVGLAVGIKGRRVEHRSQLRERFNKFRREAHYDRTFEQSDESIELPMIQTYHSEAVDGIYNLSGFVHASPDLRAFRGSVKVLQRPRRVGIGLCFEDAPVVPELADKVVALCQRVGYFGVFEIEFIRIGDRNLMIDFNPRFYNQMAFDIARGLPLPLMAYYAACGDQEALSESVRKANAWNSPDRHIYCHRVIFDLMIRGQRLSGAMTPQDARAWRDWYDPSRKHLTEAVADGEDRLPSVVDSLCWLRQYGRHPRDFIRTMVLNA